MFIPEFVCGLIVGAVVSFVFFLVLGYQLSRKK